MQGLRLPAWKTTVFLALIFAAGALHWMLFLNYGNLTFKVHDWTKEYIYYSVIKQAIESGRLPYHIPLAFQNTQRFLAVPETNMSPQILLLPLMSIGTFVLVNTLIMYALGFAGCLAIMRRYRLSPISFAVLFMLFNFNGHITAHIGVGHSMWTAYFLLPFFFLFTVDITRRRDSAGSAIKLGVVLFLMMLQGGFHLFVWSLGFLALVAIFNWRLIRPVILAAASGLLLSAFRLIPAAFTLVGRSEKFIWSYPTLRDLFDALITIRQQTPDRLKPWGTTGWWEYDIYIGLLGLAVILYFGVYLRFRRKPELEDYRFSAFDLPVLTFTAFSISYFQAFLSRIPLPLLKSQRVASRFIILPVVFLIFLAVIRIERTLETASRSVRLYVAVIIGLAVMALSFVDHSFIWSVARLQGIYRDRIVDLTVPAVIPVTDGSYKSMLLVGVIVSLASLAAIIYLAARGYGSADKNR